MCNKLFISSCFQQWFEMPFASETFVNYKTFLILYICYISKNAKEKMTVLSDTLVSLLVSLMFSMSFVAVMHIFYY